MCSLRDVAERKKCRTPGSGKRRWSSSSANQRQSNIIQKPHGARHHQSVV
jgi:hypothetical protein